MNFIVKGVECVSAGIIFWRNRNGIEILVQLTSDKKTKHMWIEDFGGKKNPEDACIRDVAVREAAEETNAVWGGGNIEKCSQLINVWMQRCKVFVNRRAKYALYLVHCPLTEKFDFGPHEIGLPFIRQRLVGWIPLSQFMQYDVDLVHPRIRHFWRSLANCAVDRDTSCRAANGKAGPKLACRMSEPVDIGADPTPLRRP